MFHAFKLRVLFFCCLLIVCLPLFLLDQFERDVMIWNNKRFLSKPLLVKEDAAILRHRRWFSQFYSQNSQKLSTQKGQLDW